MDPDSGGRVILEVHGNRFGEAIGVSDDGRTVAVGAPWEGSDATGVDGDQLNDFAPQSGAVYVFQRQAVGWSQGAYIKPSVNQAEAWFGKTLALSDDGRILSVGAPRHDVEVTVGGQTERVENAGMTLVFERGPSGWSEQLAVPNPGEALSPQEQFGGALGLSGDGRVLAVAAFRGRRPGAPSARGVVYVYRRTALGYGREAQLGASNADPGDVFGRYLSLSGDGRTLAVGTPIESSAEDPGADNAPRSGAVYVFTEADGRWSGQALLKADNLDALDSFSRVSLGQDGDLLALRAPGEDSTTQGLNGNRFDDTLEASGAVYLFRRERGAWSQLAYIKAENRDRNDRFGIAAVSGDGALLAIGSPPKMAGVEAGMRIPSTTARPIAGPGTFGDFGSTPEAGHLSRHREGSVAEPLCLIRFVRAQVAAASKSTSGPARRLRSARRPC